MSTFTAGQLVTWLHEPRGGYGYTVPVDGVVIKVGKRVKIAVQKRDGTWVQRWVTEQRLRAKED